MTTLLGRYIIAQVLLGTTFALLLLVTLDGVFALIGEIGDIGRGRYGFLEALAYVLLTLPRRAYEMIPTAALLGGLLWLGNLAANSELTALRSAGVTLTQLVVWILQAGLLIVLAMLALGEIVAPNAEARAQNLKAFAFDERLSVGQIGLWARDGQRIIQADTLLPGQQLSGVRIFELDDHGQLSAVHHIERARFVEDAWVVDHWAQSRLTHQQVFPTWQEHGTLERLIAPDYFHVLVVEPRQMGALDLARYVRYLEENYLDAAPYAVAFWQRITLPASTWVMLLLAIPFLFGSQRDSGAGRRLFIGLVLGIGFVIIMRVLTHFGLVYNLAPWLAASAPLWIFLALALVGLKRLRV